MQLWRENRGTTLIELLVALSLVALVGSGLFTVYWAANNSYKNNSGKSDAQYMARKAMEDIVRDIKEAQNAVAADGGNSLVLTGSGNVTYSTSAGNTSLYRNTQPVATNIAAATFSIISSANATTVEITLQATVDQQSYTLKSRANTRSKSIAQRPVITLIGPSWVDLPRGQIYVESGATVDDDVDGQNIPLGNENIGGYVDVNTAGLYILQYNYINSAGIAAGTVIRTVSVNNSFNPDVSTILPSTAGRKLYVWDSEEEHWTTLDPGVWRIPGISNIDINDVVTNGDNVVLVGEGTFLGRIAFSDDGGETWQNIIENPFDPNINLSSSINSITYANGLYVAVGTSLTGGGRILTSTDGQNWTEQTPTLNPLDHPLRGVTWGNNGFVAVGDEGEVYTSTNGDTWHKRNTGTNKDLNGVAWDAVGAQFIAVGADGTIITSPSGQNNTWTSQLSGTTKKLNSVAMATHKMIAVGDTGTILYSEDGVHWNTTILSATIDPAVRAASITKISCSNGVLVATVNPSVTINVNGVEKKVLLQSNNNGASWQQMIVEPAT